MADFIKDPDAVLDYTRDWADWLGDDTIATSTWIIAPLEEGGLTVKPDSESNTDTTTTVWLNGGSLGADYQVTNRITTTAGRTDDRTWIIAVRNR